MTHGLVLGKFLPPHAGHRYLIEFARRFADDVTVVVGSLAREPIPGAERFRWIHELFPAVRVLHLTDENPQAPEEHPDFWEIWRRSLERLLPGPLDYLFASDAYGARLAEVLGARFVPVDPARSAFPISATAIRAEPWAHARYLPRPVRPHFLRRVSIFGPESTGKTRLARRLATHYATIAVPEYARTWLAARGAAPVLEDMAPIARGQAAAEDALAPDARELLICDTDPLATAVWSETLFGECPPGLEVDAASRRYDLTLLLDVDVPWQADPVRYLPEDRRGFFQRCARILERYERPFVVVDGCWERRFESACEAIDAMLAGERGAAAASPGPAASLEPWWRDFYDDLLADVMLVRHDGGERELRFVIDALGVSPGQRLFDQCCGIGSLAVPLAARTFDVIGVDRSARYVERARQDAAARGVTGSCQFVEADACRFAPSPPCDGAFNWWTGFAHEEDEGEHAAMLARAFESLRPGARFLLDFMNAPGVLRGFQPCAVVERSTPRGHVKLTRKSRLELETGALLKTWIYDLADGRQVTRQSRLRLYHPHELASLAVAAGFVELRFFGGVDGAPLRLDSQRCIVLGRRPGEPS